LRRDPLASSANGWYVTFGCHPPSRQGTEVPRRETGCGKGDGVARAIAIALECPTVDRTFGMLAPAQRATPGKGLRLASQTLIPGHVRREPDVGHPTPEARLLPTYANLRAAANSHQRRKKKIFSSLGPRIRPLDPQERGWRSERSDGSVDARGRGGCADCAVGSG